MQSFPANDLICVVLHGQAQTHTQTDTQTHSLASIYFPECDLSAVLQAYSKSISEALHNSLRAESK